MYASWAATKTNYIKERKLEVKQFSLAKIIAYHLLPGIPILLITIFLSHPTWGLELPIYLSVILAILFGLIPVQLGVLFITARRQGRRIRNLLSCFEKTSILTTTLMVVFLIFYGICVFSILAPIEHPLWTIFSWVPDWFRLEQFNINSYSTHMITIMLVLAFFLNGLFGPFVEEIYFRAFLLPRMQNLGKMAPLVNVILFSMYHFFKPWENITRIVAFTPIAYAAWYKKNVRISILTHCIMNSLSVIAMILSLL